MQQTIYPDYDNPPVTEVVCGIHFKSISNLLAPHLGLLWEKFKSDYPTCQEVAPLAPVIEQFGVQKPLSFELQEVPPLPRVWFIHKSENGIIQFQRDRLLYNWRKASVTDEYPRYPKVIQMFKEQLINLKSFLSENKFGQLEPLQYEMSYINHIPEGEGWNNLSDVGKILPDYAFREGISRFLPGPEAINWRTSFLLPENFGRMHITIRNAKRKEDEKQIILIDLTVRGIGSSDMESWFNLARKWIVFGFTDITGDEVQRTIWRRRN